MLHLRRICLFLILPLLVACGKAQDQNAHQAVPSFQAGKDYQIISTSDIIPVAEPKQQVHVVEFFSYACPGCYRLEPQLEAWLAKQSNDVIFERVPVVFRPDWQNLARMYYIAQMLGVEKALTPEIFKAIHAQNKDLTNADAQKQFFKAHGVSEKDFDSMAAFSPGIDAQLVRSDTLMSNYKIVAAPTLVIDQRFKLNPAMTNGEPQRFFQVLDYLIQKVRKGEN